MCQRATVDGSHLLPFVNFWLARGHRDGPMQGTGSRGAQEILELGHYVHILSGDILGFADVHFKVV